MTDPSVFVGFPKIARWNREVIVTEKIDGTNCHVVVPEDPSAPLLFGSKSNYITPEHDHFEFAAWATKNENELRGLGPGRHFGEFWGGNIGKRYRERSKEWSLFNVDRWRDGGTDKRPACCSVVPVLWRGMMDDFDDAAIIAKLRTGGSVAAPGCVAEGIVIFHTASGISFKRTLEKDEEWKGKQSSPE